MATFTDNLLATLDEQIDDLTQVINTLTAERTPLLAAKEALLEKRAAGDSDESTPAEEPKVTKTKSSKSKKTSGGMPTDPDELREWRLNNLKKARAARAAKSKGKVTRREEILSRLDAGETAADIAEELGISKGYVYNTRNRAKSAA